MFKFYRDVVILFAIFFAYLMMAGGTTPIEGVIASLGAGCQRNDGRTKASERRITTEGII